MRTAFAIAVALLITSGCRIEDVVDFTCHLADVHTAPNTPAGTTVDAACQVYEQTQGALEAEPDEDFDHDENFDHDEDFDQDEDFDHDEDFDQDEDFDHDEDFDQDEDFDHDQ